MINTSEGNDANTDLVTPPRKKLKQARLSFQKISPGIDVASSMNIKKRKISEDSSGDLKIVKVIKPDSVELRNQDKKKEHEACNSTNVVDKKRRSSESDVIEVEVPLSNGNADVGHSNNELKNGETLEKDEQTEENKDASSPSEKKSPLCELSIVETNNSSDIKQVDPETCESDSSESSDSENELNVTVEDHNSSGSCSGSVKGDDGTKETGDEQSKSNLLSTPKSNFLSSSEKKKLTPKQLQKREESVKRREEKRKLREEKERKRAEDKKVKLKERLEIQEKKKKEKEEKEEQRRKEKEEKEKKKQAELEQKSEEKRLKEEERRKKEELRELEKKKKEGKKFAEKEAKRKESAAFVNFFVPSKGESKQLSVLEEDKIKVVEQFMPFQVKADMRLAPLVRTKRDGKLLEDLEKKLSEQSSSDLYLQHLKQKSYIPGKSGKTWPLSDFREVIILDDDEDVSGENEVIESHPTITQPKAKLLAFYDNRRPPYWGTWSKKSIHIGPKQPFVKDEGFFDYEVDSDDEWEEEEPGESLHGSDDEKESEDEYEVDNEFFVPHGYLSDEENNEEEETTSPESMQAKLKFLEMEFEEEMKHKTERIKPRLFGCFWMNQNTNEVSSRVITLLSSYGAVFQASPITLAGPLTPEVGSPSSENQTNCPSTGSRKKKFPESLVPELIKLIHGNINSRGFLVKEFSSFVRNQLKSEIEESENDIENRQPSGMISKLKIHEKIKELSSWMACPEDGPFLNRMCWYVPLEIRASYGLEELVIPNKVWKYTITPKRKLELSNTIPSPVVNDSCPRAKSVSLITKFTKKLSQEERLKQLAAAGSYDDGDIEILDMKKDDHDSKLSKGAQTSKGDDMQNISPVMSKYQSTPLKSLGGKQGKEKSSGGGIREKLLQFKAKNLSVVSNSDKRKRVKILKSAPLGQAISPSISKISSSDLSDHQRESDNRADEGESSKVAEVIELD